MGRAVCSRAGGGVDNLGGCESYKFVNFKRSNVNNDARYCPSIYVSVGAVLNDRLLEKRFNLRNSYS